MDMATHPGRTVTDELVPSRYALRVGEIDVLGRSRVVPVLPGGARRRRLSLGTSHLGVLIACWVRAELSAAPDREPLG